MPSFFNKPFVVHATLTSLIVNGHLGCVSFYLAAIYSIYGNMGLSLILQLLCQKTNFAKDGLIFPQLRRTRDGGNKMATEEMNGYEENYVETLREEMVQLVQTELTPIAAKYSYSKRPLENCIKWRPLVLVLGNHASGKSTLINEFVGGEIQKGGEAPTDDAFTVITYDEHANSGAVPVVTEELEGNALLLDPSYPFDKLKNHGGRFAAQFRMKKVDSPFLKNLAIIDTPGSFDTMAERDRGYNYQHVVADLAELADLVLVVFDPRKGGSIGEAYASLKEALPAKTFADRLFFILNRVDTCATLRDFLRVYGTLCWNLGQMTGRKEIPNILLTYAPSKAAPEQRSQLFLGQLDNQIDQLKAIVSEAPRYRLDHLALYIEEHAYNLVHLLESLKSYGQKRRQSYLNHVSLALMISIMAGLGIFAAILGNEKLAQLATELPHPEYLNYGIAAAVGGFVLLIWLYGIMPYALTKFHVRQIAQLDQLSPQDTPLSIDSWEAVKTVLFHNLEETSGRFSLRAIKRECNRLKKIYREKPGQLRDALRELSAIRHQGE